MSVLVPVSIFRPTVVRQGEKSRTIVWWIAWRDPITKIRKKKSSGTADKTEARQKAAALSRKLTMIRAGVYDPVQDNAAKPWSEIASEFLDELKKRVGGSDDSAVSADTWDIYDDALSAFARVAKPQTASDISTKLIEGFAADRLSEVVVPHRVARIVGRLRAALDWAHQNRKKLAVEALAGQSRRVRGLLRSVLKWQSVHGEISAGSIDAYEEKHRVAVIKPATINKQLRCLRAVLRWAKRRDYIREVPDFEHAFARVDKRDPVVISPDEFERLVAAVQKVSLFQRDKAWWRLFLLLSYGLGTRRGETLGVRWRDVDLLADEIFVSSTISKGRRDRMLALISELRQELLVARGSAGPDDFVLPWPKNKDLTALYPEWHRIVRAAGIKRRLVPHHCRSSAASQMIEAGVPTLTVRDQLGHSSVKTTEASYVAVSKVALRGAATARQRLLQRPEAG